MELAIELTAPRAVAILNAASRGELGIAHRPAMAATFHGKLCHIVLFTTD